ncbi:hypothetical protein PUR71_39085 [Streptomyces sp. SP17BM10]|uniref:hypothetical protein n=1 Tax=Streptomyces sp. SP17BM10 TaxID=3002530 RepID=UPI002E793D78|nr:hypothetical protein [Streptomyces sp. SP17BM10]MEE1788865.1 hypothetical protein [Streptomyces sp. SP17BM10]
MGDGQELVTATVDALVRAPGSAVAQLVRTRLRAVPGGGAAEAAAGADPADPRARAALTAAVGRLLAEDPAFARYLLSTELGPPANPSTVRLRTKPADPPTVHLQARPGDAGTVQLRLKPVSGRRATGGILVTLALVVVASLVALGINLGNRPLLQPGVHGIDHAATALRDPAQAQGVLPGPAAMPGGWRVETAPQSGTSSGDGVPCFVRDACDQQLAYATVTFRAGPRHSAKFVVVTFASAATAGRAFDAMLTQVGGADAAAAVPLPSIGDQSAARSHGAEGMEALVRVGTTLLSISDSGADADAADAPALTAFARLLAARAQQAQDGRTPDATVPGSKG